MRGVEPFDEELVFRARANRQGRAGEELAHRASLDGELQWRRQVQRGPRRTPLLLREPCARLEHRFAMSALALQNAALIERGLAHKRCPRMRACLSAGVHQLRA